MQNAISTITEKTQRELTHMAQRIVEQSLRAGASDAEAVALEAEEFSVKVRLGQVEQLV